VRERLDQEEQGAVIEERRRAETNRLNVNQLMMAQQEERQHREQIMMAQQVEKEHREQQRRGL
jgi:hypothetical protein